MLVISAHGGTLIPITVRFPNSADGSDAALLSAALFVVDINSDLCSATGVAPLLLIGVGGDGNTLVGACDDDGTLLGLDVGVTMLS